MSRWISTSDLESSMGHKILIAGLQEAGKTAIKRIFFLKQEITQVEGLKATIDYERMAVKLNNIPLTVVDLGGQRIFIRRFLNAFSPFIFNSVKIFIFVIDVSVKSTRNNAIQYFGDAIKKLKEFSPNSEIYVFLHKNDLVRNLPNYESVHAQLKEQFQLESENQIKFFRTTIFDDITIIDAFGRIIELSIPKAAKSEFVDGRAVGGGEEFSDKFAVSLFKKEDELSCPFCNIQLFQTENGFECNICGHQAKKKLVIDDDEPMVSKVSVEDLKSKLNTIKVRNGSVYVKNVPHLGTNKYVEEKSPSSPKSLINNNLESNYKKMLDISFNKKDFEDSVTEDHKLFLNFCINFKISKDILIFMVNEFIPKFSPTKLNVNNDNLIQLVLSFKNGFLKSQDFLKFIYFNEYFDNLTIDDILWNNYPNPFEEKIGEEIKVELEKESLSEDLILLSKKENIGAKIYPKDYNAEIVFYQGKMKLGNIRIPFDITDKDLKFMLVFEVKFPVNSNLQGFVEQSTLTLLGQLNKYKHETLPIKEIPDDSIVDKTKIKETGNLKLTEFSDIFFKISIKDSNFEVQFTKEERNFGKISGPDSISAPGMFQLIKNETLISTLINEDDLMFIALEIFNKFSKLLKN